VEHDLLAGEVRAEWCASRRLDDVVAELTEAGIPAAAMVPAYATLDDPQLRARGFFSPIEHPLVGEQEYPGFPMRFWSEGPEGGWWSGRPAPLLGQHTEEVLRAELGLTDVELAHLRAEQVIGERPVGA
jgi:crotonobetainyl-CoA:carnitine CoA-transferase CaiB-like acyl-CoA transferase